MQLLFHLLVLSRLGEKDFGRAYGSSSMKPGPSM